MVAAVVKSIHLEVLQKALVQEMRYQEQSFSSIGFTFLSSIHHILLRFCISFNRDDTLLASTVLISNGITLTTPIVPPAIIQQFEPLQDQVIRFIETAFTFTKNIFVITNAEVSAFHSICYYNRFFFQRGWVELSAEKFMPRVAQLVPRLNVFSARTTFQDLYQNQPEAVYHHFFFLILHNLLFILFL